MAVIFAALVTSALTICAQPAPVGYLPCDEGAGTVAHDAIDQHNATLFGATGWETGLVGPYALSFPGFPVGFPPGSYAEIPSGDVLDTTQSYTVAAWVKLKDLNGYQTFVSEDGDFQSAFFLQLRGDSHQFSFTIPYNFFILSQSGFTPVVNHWYHLAGVYDAAAQSASLYVNGVLANAVYNVPPRPANGLTGIGRGWYNNSRVDFNHAAVDDVRFYNSALSAADVFKVALIGNPSSDGKVVYARAQVPQITTSWAKYTVPIRTFGISPTENTRYVISTGTPGTFWLTQVSLFRPTFNSRPNGNRIDLMAKMAAMKPGFLRMPGGNYLEGITIDTRFDWKKTIGPIEQRPGHQGTWGYRSDDGLGLLEFLEWCEDLQMQPVLAVYAGYSLNGTHVNPGPDLVPYVQDALDEIQYVTGPTSTTWGARRAADGHPAPFPLKYVEIGNEDFFDGSGSYDGRFAQFYDASRVPTPI
jgi:concanavalin A-like lectin/glucanase superfamily protein/alpha-L-arabinofuranosidase-like protein